MSTARWHRIEHRTTYRYSDVVSASYGRGFLRPRELPWQQCLDHQLSVHPSPSDRSESEDGYGNVSTYFHVTQSHTELTVTGVSTVRAEPPHHDLARLRQPWEQARPAVDADPEAVEFVLPSPQVQLPAQVRAYAELSFRPGRPLFDAIVDLTSRIHADFNYRSGATDVDTTIATVLAERAGVCQDFAQLAVACVRSVGLPARYVSGYLATDPPPGKDRMVGADATHAWAAVRAPGGSWLAFDPTNDQLADERYTTVAWGRDYNDVPPLRGVIFTDATTSEMTVAVDVAPIREPA